MSRRTHRNLKFSPELGRRSRECGGVGGGGAVSINAQAVAQ